MSNSIVDNILQRYGMRWELNPYRIINKNGIIVQRTRFDLSPKTLISQENIGQTVSQYPKNI